MKIVVVKGVLNMDKKYIPAILELTDIFRDMELVSLKHGVTYYYWIVKLFDLDKQDEINTICEENNLRWDVKASPLKNTNGKSTSTGNLLNDVRYKRKPLSKGKLPLEEARAKIIIHEA